MISVGTRVFGLASFALGIIGLIWGDFATAWQPIQAFGTVPGRAELAYVAALLLTGGGLALQWPRSVRAGAAVLAVIYFLFALLWTPRIVGFPRIFGTWGGFIQELAPAVAAAIVYASGAPQDCAVCAGVRRIGRYLFGLCVISFGFAHFFAVSQTAALVPVWIPGHTFWAVATGVAFVLAALAMLLGILDVLAARLLTAMLLAFGLLVWLPQIFAFPAEHLAWAANAVNLVVAGAAWIVAERIASTKMP